MCAIVKATRALPSGFSFIAINTNERVHRVLNDARVFSLLFSLLCLFFILVDRRSYVHFENADYLDTRIISDVSCELPETSLQIQRYFKVADRGTVLNATLNACRDIYYVGENREIVTIVRSKEHRKQ